MIVDSEALGYEGSVDCLERFLEGEALALPHRRCLSCGVHGHPLNVRRWAEDLPLHSQHLSHPHLQTRQALLFRYRLQFRIVLRRWEPNQLVGDSTPRRCNRILHGCSRQTPWVQSEGCAQEYSLTHLISAIKSSTAYQASGP